ncbi:hypothetical protein IscW_ISCW021776 [Ixodes scapularis]|uniref:Uncharacterized protein n=1 Tax=Ixodes scapularis TaxID=6945 RepID=B7Q4S4_IXOSC|nr:hypothetical protein IscW_ISCW021776 [Ixodes scapularis]|eukprot:XP_002411612.1 hypothetical protein IscW_ISCW021776 [Ixodes scapularis]
MLCWMSGLRSPTVRGRFFRDLRFLGGEGDWLCRRSPFPPALGSSRRRAIDGSAGTGIAGSGTRGLDRKPPRARTGATLLWLEVAATSRTWLEVAATSHSRPKRRVSRVIVRGVAKTVSLDHAAGSTAGCPFRASSAAKAPGF